MIGSLCTGWDYLEKCGKYKKRKCADLKVLITRKYVQLVVQDADTYVLRCANHPVANASKQEETTSTGALWQDMRQK